MKSLSLERMEQVEGGDCLTEKMAFSGGIAVGLVVAGALTGGIAFAVAGLAWAWIGSAATVVACMD